MVTVADTAFSIAIVRAEEGARPTTDRLFDDPYASLFRSNDPEAEEATQRFLSLPFFRDGVRLRTRFIDDFVREGLAAGLDQIVLMGAGFDARGLRLPEVAARGARVFEIDFPEQLDRKRALLAAGGATVPAWITFVECDFSAPDFDRALSELLDARGFRRGAGAIFVWEGVIGYIDREAIDRSLAFMAGVGGPGSRLVFTFGPDSFAPDTAATATRQAGFSSCEELSLDDVWRRFLPGDPHPGAVFSRLGTAVV